MPSYLSLYNKPMRQVVYIWQMRKLLQLWMLEMGLKLRQYKSRPDALNHFSTLLPGVIRKEKE